MLGEQGEIRVVQSPRWPALAVSLAFHLILALSAPYWSSLLWELDLVLQKSVEEAIENNRKNRKLVWYRIPPLPKVRNASEDTQRKTARGEKFSLDEIVVERPKAESNKQLLQQQAEQERVERELPAPNLVEEARLPKLPPKKAVIPDIERPQVNRNPMEAPPTLEASVAVSPLTLAAQGGIAKLPKPTPKQFRAPVSDSAPKQENRELSFDGLPQLQGSKEQANIELSVPRLAKIAPKKFNAPKTASVGSAGMADFGTPSEIVNANSPSLPSQQIGAGSIPKLVRRKYDAASLEAKTVGSGGSAKASKGTLAAEAPPEISQGGSVTGQQAQQKVLLGLDPKAIPPPPSNLAGAFSRGREVGPPAHVGNQDPQAAKIAGVSTQPNSNIPNLRLATPEQILGEEKAEGYLEIRLDLAKQWPRLSVPLSPNARMIPRQIEPYFRNRSVFAIVIPMEGMDRYAADWILWFSPKPKPGEQATPLAGNIKMEPPLPIWKLESKRWLVRGGEKGQEERIKLHLEISQEGRVTVKELMGRFGPELNRMVTNDLSRWVFQPAMQDGKRVDVEAIVEVPFRLPTSLAATLRP